MVAQPTPPAPAPQPPLPVEQLFMVQLAAPRAGEPLHGRVEHVLSGRRQDFSTIDELLAALRSA
ncbi:MAG: hypothetical protein JNM08_13405 [Rubrivivax sp.]|nr:hypothetical protein [Rubrivivax sp.]